MEENLWKLKEYQEDLRRRKKECEETRQRFQGYLEVVDIRENLIKEALRAEEISNRSDFKENFCQRYTERFQPFVDIADTVIDICTVLNISLPTTIPALITIKILKLGINSYCNNG